MEASEIIHPACWARAQPREMAVAEPSGIIDPAFWAQPREMAVADLGGRHFRFCDYVTLSSSLGLR